MDVIPLLKDSTVSRKLVDQLKKEPKRGDAILPAERASSLNLGCGIIAILFFFFPLPSACSLLNRKEPFVALKSLTLLRDES